MVFAVLALAAVFSLVTTMDIAVAQANDAMPDGEYNDGEHEGKSCPNKEKKLQSTEHLT